MARLTRILLGILLGFLGLAGFILPGLPGWFFLVLCFVVLSPDIPLFARIVCWIEAKLPVTRQAFERVRRALRNKKTRFPSCERDDP